MDSKDFLALEEAYKVMYAEAKDESPEKEEEDRKEDDDLAGSPNKNGDDKNGKKNGKKKAKRWWDDDGDGKGYEKGEVKEDMNKGYVVTKADKKGNTPAWQGYKKGVKKKDGSPLYRAADHLKNEEVELQEKKDKDTPDQVKAVIAYDKARKGTDDATYDSEHGDKKQAKKERDYAKWQRDQGAEFAQKSGHPWEHAKGSTREKEGKKSVKHAHVQDSYDWQIESDLWDEIAEKLTELHELGGVKFKVVPFDLQEEENWIQGAVKRPGAFTKKAKAAGMSVQQFAKHVDANKDKYSTRTERQANLAQTFSKMKKEGADYDALSSFLVQEGADDQAVNYILANWVEDDCLGKIEESEKVARGAQKRAEKLGSQRRQASYKKYGSNVGSPGKNERAGYNLARAARSSDSSLETQRTKKKKPAGEDTSQIGHYKKRDEKVTVGKRGKPLSRPKYKLTMGQRVDHHSNKALSRRDPKQNPKHTANK